MTPEKDVPKNDVPFEFWFKEKIQMRQTLATIFKDEIVLVAMTET